MQTFLKAAILLFTVYSFFFYSAHILTAIIAIITIPLLIRLTSFYVNDYLPKAKFKHDMKTGKTIGIPFTVAKNWSGQTKDTCAIAVQRIVLSLFGIDKSLTELRERQKAYGHYTQGSGSDSIALLLNGYGLKTTQIEVEQDSFELTLWGSLKDDKLLLAAVNSFLLNNHDHFHVAGKEARPDHAIIISGIKLVDDKFFISYSDTGVANGRIKNIESKILLEAIPKKSFQMTETPRVPHEAISAEDKGTSISTSIIACPNCRQKIRAPNRNIIVNCQRCREKFEHKGQA